MSSHRFETKMGEKAVLITAGWDRPLLGFFLMVEEIGRRPEGPASALADSDDVGDEEDGYVYCNLDDPDLAQWRGLPPSMDYFVTALARLGLRLPDRMMLELLKDEDGNVGNRIVVYTPEGEIAEH